MGYKLPVFYWELAVNISTKSEYGLRALIYLASNSERGAIPAREIAERWNVPRSNTSNRIKL